MFVKISQEVLDAGLSDQLADAGLCILLDDTTWVITKKTGSRQPFELYVGPGTTKDADTEADYTADEHLKY